MTHAGSRGNGPSCRLVFDGKEENYELWEVKFSGYLRSQKLHDVLHADEPDADKNAQVFGELVQCLDDTSLKLIIRDAKDKGKEALQILRNHYLGTSKPRIISLYTELTSLKMAADETATAYMIRAETASASLQSAGETISDALLVAMVLKGLPHEYKTFSTVISQKNEIISFKDFKIALRSYEETEKSQNLTKSFDNVMKLKPEKSVIRCHYCNKIGHTESQCRLKLNNKSSQKPQRWCQNCKSKTHDTHHCRYKKKNNFLLS